MARLPTIRRNPNLSLGAGAAAVKTEFAPRIPQVGASQRKPDSISEQQSHLLPEFHHAGIPENPLAPEALTEGEQAASDQMEVDSNQPKPDLGGPVRPTLFDTWDPDHPIVLPLDDPREKDRDSSAAGASVAGLGGMGEGERERERVTPFHDKFGNLMNDDALFFVQLPSHLPISAKAAPEVKPQPGDDELEDDKEKLHEFDTTPFASTIAGLEGFMGRLVFRQSGRVSFVLSNGISFDVQTGSSTKFLEELFVVSPASQQCVRLGQVAQHVLVSPNADSLNLVGGSSMVGEISAVGAAGGVPEDQTLVDDSKRDLEQEAADEARKEMERKAKAAERAELDLADLSGDDDEAGGDD